MPKIDWFKVVGTVATVVVAGLVLYGAFQYYFKKPIPVVNNYTAPVTQIHNEIKAKQHLMTGIYAGKCGTGYEGGIIISWLW